jgi:hypothetical protein
LARLLRKRVVVAAAAVVVVAVAPLQQGVVVGAEVALQQADVVRLQQTQRRQRLKRLQFLPFRHLRLVIRLTPTPQHLQPAVVEADAVPEVVQLRQQQAGQPPQPLDVAPHQQRLRVRP